MSAHAVDCAEKIDILAYRQVFVKREMLAHIADMAFHLLRIAAYVDAVDSAGTLGRTAQSAKHAHCSGLSRSVGTEETENLTFVYIESDMVDCGERAEFLRQSLYRDHFFSHCPSVL